MGLAGEIEIISSVRIGIFPILCTFVLQRGTWQCQNVKVKDAAFAFPEFC